MGATTPYIQFKSTSGQMVTLSAYFAGGDAAGYQVPVSGSGVAAATNNPSFQLPPGTWTIAYATGPATGKLRLWANGSPGPVALDMASVIAQAASGNTYGRFKGGSQFSFMFVVEAAMAA